MAREKAAYRDNLDSILAFTGGKHMLNVSCVSRYTGLTARTVKKMFPFKESGHISAETLARELS